MEELLIRELKKISKLHDNCIDTVINKLENNGFNLHKEQVISRLVQIDRLNEEDISINPFEEEDFIYEELNNFTEKEGTLNSLLIESAADIIIK